MRPPLPTSAAASLAAHALLIAAAILATAHPAHPRAAPERVIPIPFFQKPPTPTTSRQSRSSGGAGASGSDDRGLPRLPPTVDVPVSAPGPGPGTGPASGAGPGSGPTDKSCYFNCLPFDTTRNHGTYDDRSVDAAASALPGTPPPAYPPMMRDAGIGAHLTVQFTVDTTGHADPPTILTADVDGAARDAFLSAIRTSLARTRFRPAMIGTHRVRQLVQQEFEFVPLR
jgi:outer membrane biosynthesis protein TonB